MNKVHLIKSLYDFTAVCNSNLWTRTEREGTINIEDVTCLSCQKTKEYKRIKKQANEKLKQEVKQIGNDIMDRKTCSDCEHNTDSECVIDRRLEFIGDSCSDWELANLELKTYKQKIEIEIDVPVKMEVDKTSIQYLSDLTPKESHATLHVTIKKKAKTGAELIGCLCGVSSESMEKAKEYSKNLIQIAVISEYKNGYYMNGFACHCYAYPVNNEKLNQLKAELEK